MCSYFFSLLSCFYCHWYLVQGNATRRVLLLAGAGENGIYMIPGHVFDMEGSGNNFYYR